MIGAALVGLYTLAIASADGITKLIAGNYSAPQLFFYSSAIVLVLTALAGRKTKANCDTHHWLVTGAPWLTAARCVLTVLAAIGYFHAFRHLPFAQVFVFIGLAPILAGVLSGPILGETLRIQGWIALCVGALGVLCLFPGGLGELSIGHVWALMGATTGTTSMVLSRRIAKIERNALAQVFYPNLSIFVVMGAAMPFAYTSMPLIDLAWVGAYAAALFAARWLSVEALRLLPAYVATPMMNLQFVWMVAIGFVAFGEVPGMGTMIGVSFVIGSGLFLVMDEALANRTLASHRKAGSTPARA